MCTTLDVMLNFTSDTLVDLQSTMTTGSGISQFHMLLALQSEMLIIAVTVTDGPMQHPRLVWWVR